MKAKDEILLLPVREMGLSASCVAYLQKVNIDTLRELTNKTESYIKKIKKLEGKSFQEIEDKMLELGVSFRDEDEVAFLYRYPHIVKEIVSEKGKFWEHRLFVEATIINYEWLAGLRNSEIHYFSSPQIKIDKIDEVAPFITSSVKEVQNFINEFSDILNGKLQAAFGKPGEPGDEKAIIEAVQSLMLTYKQMIRWKQNFEGVIPAPEYKESISELISLIEQIYKKIDEFYEKCLIAKQTFDEYFTSNTPTKKIRIDLNVDFELDTSKLDMVLEETYAKHIQDFYENRNNAQTEYENTGAGDLSYAISSAINSANYAIGCLNQVQEALQNSSNLGVIDMFSKGFFPSLMKHASLEEAEQALGIAEDAINGLNYDLALLMEYKSVKLNYPKLTSVIELWLDSDFLDCLSVMQINKVSKNVYRTSKRIEDIRKELCKLL